MFRSKMKRGALLALVVSGALILAGCSSPGQKTSTVEQQTTNELRLSIPQAPATMSPPLAGNGDNWVFGNMLAYEPLINLEADGTMSPGLAVEWGWAEPGNKVFTLTLREGVKFSDGGELTAEGVKQYFEWYAGAGGAYSRRADFASVEVTGPLSLTITTKTPTPDLPMYFTPAYVLGDVVSPIALKNPDELGTTTAGAGQYVLDVDATTTGKTYTFVPNESYYNPDAIKFDKVTINVIENLTAALDAMKVGQIDYMFGDALIADSAKAAGFDVLTLPTSIEWIGLIDREGETLKPMGDVRVRQALSHAVNREELTEGLFGEYGTAVEQFASPGSQWENTALNGMYPYDVDKAKALLAEAGYADGFDVQIYAFGQPMQTIAQAMAGYWAEIGVNVEVKVPASVTEGITNVKAKEYPAMSHTMSLALPPTLLAGLVNPVGFYSPFGSSDSEVEAAVDAVFAASDDTVAEAYDTLQTILLEKAWFIPLAARSKVIIKRPGLEGVELTEGNMNPDPVTFFVK